MRKKNEEIYPKSSRSSDKDNNPPKSDTPRWFEVYMEKVRKVRNSRHEKEQK